jgi:hypothetical protein
MPRLHDEILALAESAARKIRMATAFLDSAEEDKRRIEELKNSEALKNEAKEINSTKDNGKL